MPMKARPEGGRDLQDATLVAQCSGIGRGCGSPAVDACSHPLADGSASRFLVCSIQIVLRGSRGGAGWRMPELTSLHKVALEFGHALQIVGVDAAWRECFPQSGIRCWVRPQASFGYEDFFHLIGRR